MSMMQKTISIVKYITQMGITNEGIMEWISLMCVYYQGLIPHSKVEKNFEK